VSPPTSDDQPARWRIPAARWRIPVLVGAVIAVLLLALVGWLLLSPGNGQRPTASGTGQSHQPSATSSPSSSDSPSASPSVTPAGMRTFVTDYLQTVTSDPRAAWGRLTPAFQRASGGYQNYYGWWSTVDSATLSSSTANPADMTVSYSVVYSMSDGTTRSDDVVLHLVRSGSSYKIAGEG
jgi:hypothetical protein